MIAEATQDGEGNEPAGSRRGTDGREPTAGEAVGAAPASGAADGRSATTSGRTASRWRWLGTRVVVVLVAVTVVPVGQPVFVSIERSLWQPVEGTLTHEGVTAQVRAEPVGLRVITGDPAAATASCDGPGRPFVGGSPASAAVQAPDPEARTVVFRSATSGHRSPRSGDGGDDRRPDTWLGTVTVLWTAEWRIGDGPWIDLGTIPRTRLVARSARDLTTSLQAPG